MKFTTQITHTAEILNTAVNLTFKPVEHIEALSAKVGDKLILVYAVQDEHEHLSVEDLIGDGMGQLYKRHAGGLAKIGLDRDGNLDLGLKPDKDAVLLDCYIHSSERWSIHSDASVGRRFDTARGGGVWVPDDCLRSQLDDDEKDGKDRRAQAVLYAEQFLAQYNAIINGEVYGIVTETYDAHGGFISCDTCWGYVGDESTEKEMKMQFDWLVR